MTSIVVTSSRYKREEGQGPFARGADADRGSAPPDGRAPGHQLPRVQPIAPIRRTEPFDDPEWLFDLKYDGFRALCYLEQGRCRLISRNGNL